MGLYDYTFYDLINRNAVCFNKRQAWLEVDDQRSLTFAAYKEQVDRLAGIFSALRCLRCNRCDFGGDQLEACGGRSAF